MVNFPSLQDKASASKDAMRFIFREAKLYNAVVRNKTKKNRVAHLRCYYNTHTHIHTHSHSLTHSLTHTCMRICLQWFIIHQICYTMLFQIFFDECEALFESRDANPHSGVGAVMTELEQVRCKVCVNV